MFKVNKNPATGDLRKFGRGMIIGFGLLALLLWLAPLVKAPRPGALAWSATGPQITAIILLALGLMLCLVSYGAPGAAKRIYVAWMSALVPVGLAMSTVLLTVLFVFFLPVFSLVVRLGDPLRKKARGNTYWEDFKPYEPTLERMRRPF